MTKVIGYIRHSKDEQGGRTSPALQRKAIEDFAQARGLTVTDWHTDSAPGSKPIHKRRGLTAALAKLGPGSTLVVYRLDRLARSIQIHLALFDMARRAGAVILSTAGEGTGNGDDADSEFITGLAGLLAQREVKVLGQRLRDATAANKAKGKRWTTSPPYGFRWTADGKLAPKPSEQKTIALARSLKAEGLTLRGISDELAKRRRFNRQGNRFWPSAIKDMVNRYDLLDD